MEMRVGEKLVNELLRCIKDPNLRNTEDKRDKFRLAQKVINSAISSEKLPEGCDLKNTLWVEDNEEWVNEEGISQFQIHVEGNHAQFQISCVGQRKIMAPAIAEALIDSCLDAPFLEVQLNRDPSLREKAVKLEKKRTDFKKLFKEYSAMMMALNQKEDFTDKQIVDVGRMIDRWGELYLTLCGSSQVTNYIHALIAGHITYFLRQYKNLYRYANIGFEAFMGVTRAYIGRRTNRCGQAGRVAGQKRSIAESVGDVMIRRVAWTLAESSPNNEEVLGEYVQDGMRIRKEKGQR